MNKACSSLFLSFLTISENEEFGRFYCYDGHDEPSSSDSTQIIYRASDNRKGGTSPRIGTLLLKEQPNCFCVSEEQRSRICNYCFREKSEGMKLSRCKACKYSHYCSMECYNADQHLVECKALQKHPQVTNSMRLMLKCFLSCKTVEDVEKIENLSPKQSMKDIEDLKQLAILFCDYVKELDLSISLIGHRKTDVDYLYLLFQKIQRNTFSICNDEMNVIGSGLYVHTSLFNHSCVPNCTVLFDSKKNIYVRVINSNIKAGEPLTINYVDLLDVTPNRQHKLDKQYHFTCQCPRCTSTVNSEERNTHVESMLEMANDFKQKNQLQEAINCYSRVVSKKKSSPKLFHDIYLGIALNALAHNYVELGEFEKAYHYAVESLPLLEQYYPEFYPILGLQYLMCAKLGAHLEEEKHHQARTQTTSSFTPNISSQWFQKAFPIFSKLFIHEDNTPFDVLRRNQITF
ncbi:hypothetical protein C9374_011452 [Naegleria lovaniensis]|uniref:SET domain-containing protein n=1 Tax=Naegleria lovaniensis TaxID=51637 RepID=A0AA88H4D7_NAELO|nr:uncharacterized protein C9374_011452 [Naegleria lovaniensis]KAG2392727.1 hypothetical protein C9374_011452 [Naegleria lovaniensis]